MNFKLGAFKAFIYPKRRLNDSHRCSFWRTKPFSKGFGEKKNEKEWGKIWCEFEEGGKGEGRGREGGFAWVPPFRGQTLSTLSFSFWTTDPSTILFPSILNDYPVLMTMRNKQLVDWNFSNYRILSNKRADFDFLRDIRCRYY